ncbi:hypothetical protein NODU109028_09370 [Nocardioides dubius]|uniref:SPW repeat-containing protein n=1 Tax=Nocardioides dubius TaxID=317019 RepID=A0ABN1TVD4_9ACTN
MRRWAVMAPVTAMLVANQLAEAAGDRYWFSAILLVGFVGGAAWHYLYPRGLAERAWLWVLILGGLWVVLGPTDPLDPAETAPKLLAMLGIVGGHLIAERFGWRLRAAVDRERELVG